MINRLIHFSLRHPFFILFSTVVLCGVGIYSAFHLPVDALPDITSLQIQINVAPGAMAPEEVEKQAAVPIERVMAGLPGLQLMRSLSRFGLSQITLIFDDAVDVYHTRQLISERLQSISDQLPPGLQPTIQPVSSGLGEIFYYGIECKKTEKANTPARQKQLMDLRSMQDWFVAPMFMQVQGVAEVSASGGFEKEILIRPDPEKLRGMGATLDDLASAVRENLRNAGGSVFQSGGEQVIIRSVGRVRTAEEIRALPFRFGAGEHPILVGDVAEVTIGSSARSGAATDDGEEAVIGAVIMLRGENTREVAQRVREKMKEIQGNLPAKYEIHELYDRGDLVNATIHTVVKNLAEGALLVLAILYFFLRRWRPSLIVALAIPLSMLFAITGMVQTRLTGNLMSLGAIDFGLIVDGAVVMTENIVRRLKLKQRLLARSLSPEERLDAIESACQEMGRPMMAGVGIIALVYAPILALGGIEGKMFKPMAATVIMALAGAILMAYTLVPVLCSRLLGTRFDRPENRAIQSLRDIYRKTLGWAFDRVGLMLGTSLFLVVAGILVFSRLGAEFVPNLDEGSSLLGIQRAPSTGLDASMAMQSKTENILREQFPEIQRTFSRVGADERGVDPVGIYRSDTYLDFTPRSQWRVVNGHRIGKTELVDLMARTLAENVPGQSVEFCQPIEDRFNDFFEGARADFVIKIFGDDFETLEKLARRVKGIVETVRGNADAAFEGFGKTPMLEIVPRWEALKQYNLRSEEINRVVEAGLGGDLLGRVIEGDRPVDVVLRYPEEVRSDLEKLQNIPVRLNDGGFILFGRIADLKMVNEVSEIQRDSGRRRATVLVDIRGRDLAGFVNEARKKISAQIHLPAGYMIEYGGQFKNLESARARLGIIGPLVLGLILCLVYWAFGSWRQTLLICTGIPLALTGGVFALLLRGMPFSISAAVGFIALSGVAVLNGIVLISYFNRLQREGKSIQEATLEGALTRLNPVLMTALVASLGFVPMALATGIGAEVQRPLATVVIGGIISSTFLTLFLAPALYRHFKLGPH